jgi:hypothetical protein
MDKMSIHHDSAFHDILNTLFSTTSEKAGAIVAASMISSPLWLQSIQPVSDVAAVFAPILGCTYLSMQIGFKVWDRFIKRGL